MLKDARYLNKDMKVQKAQKSKRVNCTAKVALLLELNGAALENTQQIRDNISEALQGKVEARALTQQTRLEVSDLDEMATVEDLQHAFKDQIRVTLDEADIKNLRPAFGGTQRAIISLTAIRATKVLSVGKIKVACLSHQSFEAAIDDLVDDARDHKPAIIAGDFNAWAQKWGSDISKTSSSDAIAKGQALLEAFATLDVVLLNQGSANTFNRGGAGSVIDLIFVTSSLSPQAKWCLGNHYTASDHEALVFSIGGGSGRTQNQTEQRLAYKGNTLRVPVFLEAMSGVSVEGSAQQMANQLSEQLLLACDASMTRRKKFGGKQSPAYWWSDEIAEARRTCLSDRRSYQRARRRSDSDWPGLHQAPSMTHGEKHTRWAIIEALFATCATNRAPGVHEIQPPHDVKPVATEELLSASRKMKPNKAPGPDGIPNRAVKLAISLKPDEFACAYTQCLREGILPRQWKTQHLTLEQIICSRLKRALEESGALSENQFGFRKGFSTVDTIGRVVRIASEAVEGTRWKGGKKEYCLIVTLDIKNAFNSVKSPPRVGDGPTIVEHSLRRSDAAYIADWMPADDVALSVVAKHLHAAEEACNTAIRLLADWLLSAGLELAAPKTEAVLVSSRSIVETAHVRIGDQTIASKRAIRYLGVMMDTRLCFREHLSYVQEKAANTSRALFRLLLNTRGPKQERRLLLTSVVRSAITYAAAVWADGVKVASYARGIKSIHRLCAIRICCGFRTISDDAALVIAGLFPIDIQIIEERNVALATRAGVDRKAAREQAREESIRAWQSRWNNAEKGR
ncbi:uncharacterized protein LOC121405334 [Drosophila obscura]|uniref:uncharacterized protein LOC121405334 n=1 Tax=Drosophila obscura TaxID=7282 RepID=UPI001BB1E011|nr:uncharacterized protein LOC121405334 [Drosophila obscura]